MSWCSSMAVEQAEHRAGLVGRERLCGGGDAFEARLFHGDAGLLQRRLHPAKRPDGRGDDKPVVLAPEIFGAGVGGEQEEGVLVYRRAVFGDREHLEDALLLEHKRDGAARAEVAAGLREQAPKVGDGAVGVVREHVHEHRDAVRAVALVRLLLVVGALDLARAALDSALDVVLGHVLRLRLIDGEREARVHVGVAAGLARGHHDVAGNARPGLRLLGVGDGLLPLDLRPLVVSGHSRLCLLDVHARDAPQG